MTTLVERQMALEDECLDLGVERYEERRKEQGESATIPGKEQIKLIIPALTERIAAFVEETGRKAGRGGHVAHFLGHILPKSAAYLTLRYALDAAAAGRRAVPVAVALGGAIQDHVNLLSMKEDDSENEEVRKHQRNLYKKVAEQLKKSTSERHRAGVWHHIFKKYRPETLKWTDKNKLHIGMKLFETLEECCDPKVVVLIRQTEGKHKTPLFLRLTAEAEEWLKDEHFEASRWYPVHQPMLVKPNDWKVVMKADGRGSTIVGGYLTRVMRAKMGGRLVHSSSRGYLTELKNGDMPAVYDAVNAIQRTPWSVNKAVLDVAREVGKLGEKFQALLYKDPLPEPVRPGGIPKDVAIDLLPPDQKELLLAWKYAMATTLEENAMLRGKAHAARQQIAVAEKFADEEAVWFPHFLDFRGRVYPFSNYLNPQADDLARGLLQFANGKQIGQRGIYWLKVHIANLFGIDKVSFEERSEWVESHMGVLLDSAARPFDGERFWTTAENPWQAIAACFELAGVMVQGTDYVSHLPIAMDGSCSGLQHYSAMLRDPVGGAAVNLVPADKPADIYAEVARRAQALIDASLEGETTMWRGGKVVRKIAKQPTMTYCYGSTQYGMAKQVMKAVDGFDDEDYLGDADVRQSSVALSGVIREAIGRTVVAAKTAMEFLQQCATLAATKGLPIRWTAPSGFPVVQEYKEVVGERIGVFYQGVQLKPILVKDDEKLDAQRQASGVAPNFVHSLDSAHLMATVNIGTDNDITSWACVHDSFGVHAADVDTLHVVVREAFIEQYTPDVLSRFREEIVEHLTVVAPELVEKIPAVPAMGSLDLALLRDSPYFFA